MIFYLDAPGGQFLTTYIHVIACAIENNVTVMNLGLSDHAAFFAGTRADLFARYPSRKSLISPTPERRATVLRWAVRVQRSVEKSKLKNFGSALVRVARSSGETTLGKSDAEKQSMIVDMDSPAFRAQLKKTPALVVTGPLLRAQTSIRKHYAAVREFFTPCAEQKAAIETQLHAARGDSELLIGVHIRRSDYAKFMDGKFYYTHEQYRTCMEQTQNLFADKTVRFLMQSDEPVDADVFKPFDVCFARGERATQIYVLAGCDYLIGPPSTFLSWASFYNQVPHYKIMDLEKIPTIQDFVINRG